MVGLGNILWINGAPGEGSTNQRIKLMAYKLEGDLLEVCNCNVLCPCWIGENPDRGTCESSLAYHVTKGEIDGIDVSGLTIASTVYIPGNVLEGNWREAIYVDDRASDAQMKAIVDVFRGERGGPLADLAQLVGEVTQVQRAAITFDLKEGKGRYTVGDMVHAEMEPYKGPTGETTKLVGSIFSTIPGSPAFVAKADVFKLDDPSVGVKQDLSGFNAIQGTFAFEG
jgi:hypothetical protein